MSDPAESTLPWLRALIGERIGVDPVVLDPAERLSRYGLTSLNAASIVARLADRIGRALPPTLLWDYPTLDRLAAYLDGRADPDGRVPIVAMPDGEPIAIVGLACRLPGAESPAAFWRLLCDGRDAITEVPPDRWPIDALYDPDPEAPGRMATRWGGFIDGVDRFDAAFFGLSPREAAQTDPQQRLALELAWEALEDASIRASTLNGSRTGVFMGAMWSDYARLLTDRAGIAQHTATGQDISIVSARIAYVLGLEGPALTIDTACSSALVAVHQACRSLRAGESTVALAGGVHLLLAPESSIAMTKFGAMAPDGRCKPFDARANGYVRGEGGGIVVLKPLHAAQAARNRIYAVIRGSALNNDGPSNGLTAPNPAAQRGMLRDALADARLSPAAVDYVEAHGTGTPLGDPIEAQALATVLCKDRPADRPLQIGSVKSNIGHLEAAAGAAGLIKLALALHHRWIPASLHYRSPNPAIDLSGALRVQSTGAPWPALDAPVGGVSSFGFGGTNCHVLLQGVSAPAAGRPVFVFAGNGGNCAGMAGGLAQDAAFAAELAACDAVLAGLGYPAPLLSVLDDVRVQDVALGQPALCSFQLALTALLASRGVTPAAVIGHSVGEAAAACVAGALTREQALRLVVLRSRLQASAAGHGGMALAAAPAGALRGLLPDGVVIAGENGPRATLLAGARDVVARACQALDAAGIVSQPIDVPVAYHSPQMDPLRPELEAALADLAPAPDRIPMVSTVTAAPIAGVDLTAAYWGRNLCDPVLFRQGIAALARAGHRAFLELAPHPLLAAQIRQMVPDATVVSPVRRGQADTASVHAALAPLAAERRGHRPRHLLLLSARSEAALDALRLRWAARLPTDFPDLCHTALVGRDRFPWRLALHATDGEDARRRLLAGEIKQAHARPGAAPAFDQRRQPDETWESWLERCAAAFVAGADIDGRLFDADEPWRIVTAPTYPFERERYWLPQTDPRMSYAVTWEPFDLPPAFLAWPEIRLIADPPDPGLDAEATAFARAALASVPPEAILPRHRGLAARLAGWSAMPPAKAKTGPVAALLRRTGAALPALLTGAADPLEILFPAGDLDAATAVYRAAPFAAVQRAVAGTIRALNRPLRVLELGAGTGALTAELLPALPEDSTIVCTDVSDAFLVALRDRFAAWPALRTARFNLDGAEAPEGPFDVVVAANVVHAGASVGAILSRLRGLLAPGGVLVLAELTAAPRWIDLVFGLTEGWWRFRGDPLRPNHALLDAAGWRHALAQAGFEAIEVRPDGDVHALILARAPEPVGEWLVAGEGLPCLEASLPHHSSWPGLTRPSQLDLCGTDSPRTVLDGMAGSSPAMTIGAAMMDGAAMTEGPSTMTEGRPVMTTAPHPTACLYAPSDSPAPTLIAEITALAESSPLTIVHDTSVPHAAVAGAARALALDRPGSIAATFELSDRAEASLQAVRAALGRTGVEDQIRVTAGRLSVPRLVRTAPTAQPPAFAADRLYVVAGGFGRLGRSCARFLVERGARHLLLVGRSAAKRPAISGVQISGLTLDLTAPTAAATLRAAFDRPIGGIVHAAGIADGTPEAVLAAKLDVADSLAQAVQGLDPSFLLLFSSAAGVWGTKGHVAYAAANRALDRWAEQARAGGLPATAVAFGRFEEPGLLSAAEDAALDDAGLRAMAPAEAFTAAFQAVAEGAAHRIVAAIDWPRFLAAFEARRRRPLFAHFAEKPAPPAAAPRSNPIGLDRAGIATLLADLLGHPDASRIDPDRGFFEQGLDSLMAVSLRRRLEEAAGIPVPAAVLFSQPTVSRLAAWLAGAAPRVPAAAEKPTNEPVAIVGIGCRFAGGADGPDAYLARLLAGGDAIGLVPASRPTAALWANAPDTTRLAGFLQDVEQFDAAFFGISPREAAQLDPQQRLLLEVAWHALEHAGIAPDRLAGTRTGVFIGATGSDYAALARGAQQDAHSLVGQPNNTLAGRLAYQFGLHGPALTLDTACSSSLVALHLAVRALRSGEADMALAGGVNLLLIPDTSAMLAQAGLLAPDGRCKVFDAAADGYVRGEGCGLVVLKTLSRAQADGDRVLAIVRGSAVNHDGRSSSFTAPNGAAQAAVVRDALADAALTPDAIDLIEAHGTGTALGDPIELDALAEVFAGRDRPLLVGSVKAAIGHTEAAAGIAAVIKAALCLSAGMLPPQVHFSRLNPHAHAAGVAVATGGPTPGCRAGISAFGASGTNAHVVLEQGAAPPPECGEGPATLLLSAATPTALEKLRHAVIAALAAGLRFEDACNTAHVGRARLPHWLLADSPAALKFAPSRTGDTSDLPIPRGRRAALPSMPFDRLPHWLPAAAVPTRPALGPPHRSARSGETVWETRLDPDTAWLRDHRVEGDIVLPAAGFLDLTLSAGLTALAEVEFRRRLDIPPEGLAAQLVRDRSGDVTLYAEDAEGWSEIASARIAATAAIPPLPSPESVETLDAPAFSAELHARGFGFGPAYRTITALTRGPTGARANLPPGSTLDPPIIDAAIQALTSLLPATTQPWLPARIGRVVRGAPEQGRLTAGAHLIEWDGRHATGNAWIERDDGTPVLYLADLELRPAQSEPGPWYHDIVWRPAAAHGEPPSGIWHAIGPGAAALGCASHDESGEAALPEVDGIIDLRPLTAATPAACIAATASLVRTAAAMPVPPRLMLISRGASAAPPVLEGDAPAAAVLMGLQPVIEAEHPALRCRWVDLDPDDPGIPTNCHGPAGRYALRHGRWVTPELVKAPPAPSGPVRLVPGPERSFADLRFIPIPEAIPAPGEVLIAVSAAGLNFKDVLAILGRVPDAPLGLECAGSVLAVGAGVTGFAFGDLVLAFGPGALASRVVLPANRVLKRPDWLDADTAATLPVACLTAWHGLHDLAGLHPGANVLIHAGAGGVGSTAIRLARAAGARVFATTSPGKEAAAKAAGADAVGNSRSTDFAAAARAWAAPNGFDVVLNALGPDIAEASASLLQPDGLFLEIGNAPPLAGVRHIAYDLDQPMRADPGWFADRMQRVLTMLRDGTLQPPRRTILPLSRAGEALQALGQGRTTGKLVLRVPQLAPVTGTWLVTGGTGAVGQALTRRLVASGATRVVLAARNHQSVPGCETATLDVSDRDAVAELLRVLPDLRGVVHAAGVVRDATLDRLDQRDLAAVLAPKADAAAHLDALTRDRALDAFVLVSSTAGSLAAPGQAAYAGANAWLDRLAASRRAAGLAASSIGSGPWAGGMFARLDSQAQGRLRRSGFRPMAPHRAATAFMQVLADGAVHRLVMDRIEPAAEAAAPDGSIRAALLAEPPAQRLPALQAELARRLVTVLGYPAGTRIEPHRALRDLGLDSLLSVSLRNELAAGFGLDLPATLLFDHPTLAALATHLLALLDRQADLDEDDLAALLEREL